MEKTREKDMTLVLIIIHSTHARGCLPFRGGGDGVVGKWRAQTLLFGACVGLGEQKKVETYLDFCVSSLCRGHANLLCIVPILVYVLPKQVHTEVKGVSSSKMFCSQHLDLESWRPRTKQD